jgi:uncharacterized protein YbjT (DUF2867 family)
VSIVNVLIYGATGMVGQGVLLECERDPGVQRIVTVGRRPMGRVHEKLREIVQPDVTDLTSLGAELASIDACFFPLGTSALGKTEEEYSRLTYDLTLSIAQQLARANPRMVFVYVSGTGTDSTEHGRIMWARVKGRTENALLRCGFRAAYMFRPGVIMPLDGIRSATGWYNTLYALTRPLLPLLHRLSPTSITTTQQVGRAMISVARNGYEKPILEMSDITRF